jgi:hypothetical protein
MLDYHKKKHYNLCLILFVLESVIEKCFNVALNRRILFYNAYYIFHITKLFIFYYLKTRTTYISKKGLYFY